MKQKLLAGILSATLLLGLASCAQKPEHTTGGKDGAPSESQGLAPGGDSAAIAYSPAPLNMTPKEKDVYPYMGASIALPESLWNAVLNNEIFMHSREDVEYTDLAGQESIPADWRPTPEHTVVHSGWIDLHFLPEAMRDEVPRRDMDTPMSYDDFLVWLKDAVPMARIGMYRKEGFTETMLDESGYKHHQKLGENSEFVYYLSSNGQPEQLPQDGEPLFAAIGGIAEGVDIFEARPLDEDCFGILTPEREDIAQVGDFQTTTITGEAIDQTVFSQAKLTMVNVWTTWCGPCIEELPDLSQLSEELKGTGAQIIGIVQDTADGQGNPDGEMVEFAKTVVERTKVNYPCLIPDGNLSEGLLQGALGFPTTWFVDSQGNVVGDPVLGSHSKEDWKDLVLERLAEVDR